MAEELLKAEETLAARGWPDADAQQIADVRQLLVASDDAAPANLAALSLALFTTKGDSSKVCALGQQILRERPGASTLAFLRSLAARIGPDVRRDIERVINDLI